jgi:filamentous hemagglutinin family protein
MELRRRESGRLLSRFSQREVLFATTALQAATFAILLTAPLPAAALPPNAQPTGGSVSAGNASISRNATTTTINQGSNRAAINWQSYNVGSAQSVQYQQPSSSSVTLNRVQGPNPSEIAGKIRANGQLIIVNQAGVVFDNGSQVNAAGIVVSAAGISDSNFMAGKMVFDQAAHRGAVVENKGQITVQQSGLAALVAPQVRNSGVINARMGTVILAGAEAATLDLYGDGLVSINVTKQVHTGPGGKKALVTNTGTITASGGHVLLTADAVDGVVQNLVDAGGTISADSLPGHNGQVLISGVGGDVVVEGVIDTKGSGAGLTGGTVQVAASNRTVVTSKAQINASGLGGGGVITLGKTTGATPITSAKLTVKSGAAINADATLAGSGGTVVLSSRSRTVIAGSVSARGIGATGNTGSIAVETSKSSSAIVVAQGAQLTTSAVSFRGGRARIAGSVSGTTSVSFDQTGNVSETAPGSTSPTGIITTPLLEGSAAGTVNLTGANKVRSVGPFTAGSGFTLNDNTETLTVLGALDGSTTVVLTNTGQLQITAPVAATDSVILDANGISQSSAGVITAGTLTGSAGTGSADLGTATNLVVNLGSFSATTGLTLNDSTPTLTVISAVDGGTGVGITNTGSLAINAPVSATGTVDLVAVGIAQNSAGTVTAGTLIGNAGTGAADFAEATNLVTNLGPLTAGNGFNLNDGLTLLTIIGAVDGGTSVAITNTGSLAINAPVSATGTGTVDLVAAGIAQNSAGTITAGTLIGNAGTNAADFSEATNLVTDLGPFTVGNGFSLNNGTPLLTVVGEIDGGPTVHLINTGSLVIDAAIDPTNTVILDANGISQSSAGVITAGTLTGSAGTGSADLGTATNLVVNLGSFSATTGFTLNDSTPTLTVTGAVDGGTGVAITNTGSVAINATVSATGTVDLVAAGIAQNSAGTITAGTLIGNAGTGAADFAEATNLVTNLGPLTAGNGFNLNDGLTLLTIIGAVDGGTSVAITNTGSLAINAPVSATGTGTVDLVAAGIAQNSAGTITAGTLIGNAGTNAADFSEATNLVTDLGPFTVGNGFSLNNGTPLLTVVGEIDGGPTVHLINTGSLVIDAAIDPTNTVILDANGISQSSAGVITAGTLTGSAGTGSADLGTATNLVVNLGSFSATTGFTLNDSTPTLTVTGAVDGGTGVAITNTGSLAINAPVSATGTVDLVAVGIAQNSAGAITAGTLIGNAGTNAADFSEATNLVTDLGPFTVGNGFSLNNGTPLLTVVGEIDGGPTVHLINTGSLVIDAAIDPTNTVILDANGISQSSAGVITAGTLTGSAGTGSADLGTATNLVVNLGSFSATTGFTLNDSTPTLTVTGAVDGGTGVAITNTGSLAINAPVSATGTVDLVAVGIAQNSAGAITAGTLIGNAGTNAADFSEATNLVTDLGPFTVGNGFSLNNGTPLLTVVGEIDGGPTVHLINTGSLVIDAAIDPTNTVILDANGISQSSAGVITAGTLTGSAGTGSADLGTATNLVVNLGSFSATTGFTLNDSTPTLTVIGAVDGGTGVGITNTGSLAINAPVSATGTVDLVAVGIAQNSAGTVTAGTLIGNAGTGAADFAEAANLVTDLGPFTAGGVFQVADAHALTVIGNVTAGADATITVNGAGNDLTIDNGASIQSGGANTIRLTAANGTIANNGSIQGGALATLNAGTDLDQNGVVEAAVVTETAGRDIDHAGNSIASAGSIDLTAGNVIDQSAADGLGTISATGGNVFLIANGTTQAADIAQSAGALIIDPTPAATIDLTAATGIAFAGTVGAAPQADSTAPTGTVVFTAQAGDITEAAGGSHTGTVLALDLSGSATAGGGAVGQALFDAPSPGGTANQVVNLGGFTASNTFALTDGHALSVTANVNAGSDAIITVNGAGNGLTVDTGVTVRSGSGGATALTASAGDITNNGSVIGGTLAGLAAGSDIAQNNLVIAAAVTETAGGNLQQNGVTDASGGSAALTAGNNLTQSGIVAASADAALTATAGTLTQNGTVTAGGNGMLVAGGDLAQNASVMATTGNAALTAGNDLIQSGIVTAGSDIDLTAGSGSLTQNGTVSARRSATLFAGTNLLQNGLVRAIGSDASLTAGEDLTQSAIVFAGGNATLTAGDNLAQNSIVTAGADASLTATNGALVQSGTVTAGHDATLTAAAGTLTQNGVVTAGNSASLFAGANLLQNGTVRARDGSATLTASDDLMQSGIVVAGNDARLATTSGTLTQNGSITANNDATLLGDANMFQNGTVLAINGNAKLTAADNLAQSGSVIAGTVAALTATTGTVTQKGAITAGSNATLNAGGDLIQTGTIRAINGTASLTANNNLVQSAIVTAGVDAMLAATNGTLGQIGMLIAGGSATLTAGGSLTQSGVVTAGIDTTLIALGPSLVQTGSLMAGTSAIVTAINGSAFDGGTITAPNIQISAADGLVALYGTLAGVKPDPSLNPLFKLAQGAFPSNPAIGAWIIGSNIVVAPNVLVTGAGGGASELVIVLTNPHGLVSFGNFNNPSTELYLNLSTGLAAGQIAVKALQVKYAPPGTSQTINLLGTVNGQSGSTAASASFIQPKEKNNYQINGCPIGSANCIQITTIVLPVVNPLKDLEVSTPDQPDDILIILPDVGDRDY